MTAAVGTSSNASSGTFGAFRHPRFRRVWAASLVDQTGSWFMIAGRAFLVYDLTGSAVALGTIYFFSLIPMVLFSQYGGALADRLDRRRLLIACQVAMTAASLAIGVIDQAGVANMVNLCALAFAYGVFQALSSPAQQSLVPVLVPRSDLTSAIALQSVASSGSRIIGPLLAGVLLPIVGSAWLFYLNSISFVFVIAAWISIKVEHVAPIVRTGTWQATSQAFRYARARPAIFLPLAAAAIVGGIGLSYSPQVASFASVYLADGDEDAASRYYGLIQMTIGIGSVIGVILLPRVGHRRPAGALLVGVFGFGLALMGLGLFTTPPMTLTLSVLLGGTQFATGAHVMSLLQHNVDDEFRGRVVGLYQLAFVGLFPIFGLLGGALASGIGVAPVFVVTGALCVLCAIPIATRRREITV